MSRYDREAAFFDSVHEFGKAHQVLDALFGFLIGTVFFGLTLIGPAVGWTVMSWTVGFDPESGSQTFVGGVGGSMGCAALVMAYMAVKEWRDGRVATERSDNK